VVRERAFDNFNNFNQRILGLLPETACSMLPFSFESENRTVRGILSMGDRELLRFDYFSVKRERFELVGE
jgi:hypothetical protein